MLFVELARVAIILLDGDNAIVGAAEFCGSESHEHEFHLAVEDIDHTRTKTKSPQSEPDPAPGVAMRSMASTRGRSETPDRNSCQHPGPRMAGDRVVDLLLYPRVLGHALEGVPEGVEHLAAVRDARLDAEASS